MLVEEPSSHHVLVRDSGVLLLWGHILPFPIVEVVIDLVRCPEGEHAFKVKVGVYHGYIKVGES